MEPYRSNPYTDYQQFLYSIIKCLHDKRIMGMVIDITYNGRMINKNLKIKKKSDPFPYVIIDNFFTDEFFLELEKNFPIASDFTINNVGRMHFDTTYGDNLYNELLTKSKTYQDLHDWVYGEDFIKYFFDLFDDDLGNQIDLIGSPKEFDIRYDPVEVGEVFDKNNFQKEALKPYLYPRIDLGCGKKNYGISTGGKGPHIDNPQRLISILVYVGGFENMTGGEHRIYKKSSDNLQVFESIKPIKNRLIASLQNNDAFHDVNPVVEIDGQRNAFYLAISSSKKIWLSCERNKFNINYNKNRVESSFLRKTLNRIKGLIKHILIH